VRFSSSVVEPAFLPLDRAVFCALSKVYYSCNLDTIVSSWVNCIWVSEDLLGSSSRDFFVRCAYCVFLFLFTLTFFKAYPHNLCDFSTSHRSAAQSAWLFWKWHSCRPVWTGRQWLSSRNIETPQITPSHQIRRQIYLFRVELRAYIPRVGAERQRNRKGFDAVVLSLSALEARKDLIRRRDWASE
jgi:hypothetical protein